MVSVGISFQRAVTSTGSSTSLRLGVLADALSLQLSGGHVSALGACLEQCSTGELQLKEAFASFALNVTLCC